ncbi:MAG TPA: Asp-tRNA(Asn)/Glu-tRNA(Gln) amidotransferase subunit GatB [Candidatus Saccharimonadia bacterium]
MKYETIIGIECHVQLATKSKLFCACNNDSRDAEPNVNVCPVCLGFPGALPVLNGAAVRLALKAGHALHAYEKIGEFHSKFDRKNYFYPDSPKNYQITQFDEPIIGKGYVEFPVEGNLKRVGITRAHLEGDAGKLVHPAGADYSLVDLNRSDTPLLEIVSEPDMRTAAEAKAYAQELHNLMRYAEVSDADLYHGNMRFDVNVSLRPVGSKAFGIRTESKNLNSFRAVAGVVEYETKRQAEVLDNGEKVLQETRGWDENNNATFSQRSKEEAHDYRYFPDPDLPPMVITKKMLDDAKDSMPATMPNSLRTSMNNAGIKPEDVETLISDLALSHIFKTATDKQDNEVTVQIVKWLLGEFPHLLTPGTVVELDQARVDVISEGLRELARMQKEGVVSSTAAKQVLAVLVPTGGDPRAIAEKMSLIQVSDSDALEKIVDEVLAANPKPADDYKAGEAKALGFLVGQVMKASKGQANPPMVNAILKKKLGD